MDVIDRPVLEGAAPLGNAAFEGFVRSGATIEMKAFMPDIGANALSIAFGNFKAGYIIAERTETVILRDPYSNKPFVNFYATKRVGGCVTNSEAIKLMKFAVS